MDEALQRYAAKYCAWADERDSVEAAAMWLIENRCPYRKGQQVKCPNDNTSSAGKVITITSISIDCCRKTRRIYWCISGKEAFFRIEHGREDIPQAKDPPMGKQGDLF